MNHNISGAGGDSKDGAGAEALDSLSSSGYARLIDLIGEGQIKGLVNGGQSIYLDGVPLKSLDGSTSARPFSWVERVGTQDQGVIPGFSGTLAETSVGVQVRKSMGRVIRRLTDQEAEAVRVTVAVPALSLTTKDEGIKEARVDYQVWVRPLGGAWTLARTDIFEGKVMARYQRQVEITLSGFGTGPWDIGVDRVTDDTNNALLVNDLYWDSFTTVNYEQLSYPNSALVALELDARYFSQIPQRSYHVRGLLIRIPTNLYPEGVPAGLAVDPANPSYATSGAGTTNGVWDGSFKVAYSDNPAWCYYDLALNKRYGLGRRLSASQVDKWAVYQVGRYCDQLVPTGLALNISDLVSSPSVTSNGAGTAGVPTRTSNLEKRFTLNCVLNTRESAYKVLSQLTSVFRGMAYWSGGALTLTQDRPTPVTALFTNANVENGSFSYQGSSKNQRHTTCTVSWNDPANDFKATVEYVEDREGIERYGINNTDLTAFGCTSRSQARRVGLHVLLTERRENDTVAFVTGLEGTSLKPGQVIQVADSRRAGARWGGRVMASTLAKIDIDAPVTLAAGPYTLSVMAQDGAVTTRQFTLASGATLSSLTPSVGFSTAPAAMAIWTLASYTLTPRTVRIVSVRQEGVKYSVTGLLTDPSKFAAIDTGAAVRDYRYTTLSSAPPKKVTGMAAREDSFKPRGAFDVQTTVYVGWDRVLDPMVRGYLVKLYTSVGGSPSEMEVADTTAAFEGVLPGTYTASVRAVTHLGATGAEATVGLVVTGLDGKAPDAPTGFAASSLPGGVLLMWDSCPASDYIETEVRSGASFAAGAQVFQGYANKFLLPWPAQGVYTLWAAHRDSSGNTSPPASLSLSVGAETLISWSTLTNIPINAIYNSAVGQSGNLLANSTFGGRVVTPWAHQGPQADYQTRLAYFGTESGRDADHPFSPEGMDAICVQQNAAGPGGDTGHFLDIVSELVAVKQGTRYGLQARLAAHRCNVQLFLEWFTEAKAPISATFSPLVQVSGGKTLDQFALPLLFATPPTTAAYCRPLIRKYNTLAGQSNSFMWVLAPMLHVAGADQVDASPYSPSTGQGLILASTAKAAADSAQGTASNAALAAAQAQTAAGNAATAAGNAQTSATSALNQLTDLASDNILSSVEKPAVVEKFNVLIAEQAGIAAQAQQYGITTEWAAYGNAITNLTSYLNGLSGWSTIPGVNVAIVGTTFRQKFSDAYAARQTLLNKISATAKNLADAAQTSATAAQNAAATAQAKANEAAAGVADINSDGTISPAEKLTLRTQWADIGGSKDTLSTRATALGITAENQAFVSAVDALAAWLSGMNPGWTDTTQSTPVDRIVANQKWQTAFNARANLETKIAAVTAGLANTAQDTANQAKAKADANTLALTDINSDGTLSPSEKRDLITRWDDISSSIGPLVLRAGALGITTERTAFEVGANDLASWLVSLNPAWNYTSASTTIDRNVANQKWATAYATRANLEAKIAEISAKTADWSLVRNTPEQSNLCWNGAGPTTTGWSSGVTMEDWGVNSFWATNMGMTGSRYALTTRQRDSFFGDRFSVTKGDLISASADAAHTFAATGGYNCGIGLVLFRSDGTPLSYQSIASLPASKSHGHIQGVIEIPGEASHAQVWMYVDGYSDFTSPGKGGHFTNINVGRVAKTLDIAQDSVTSIKTYTVSSFTAVSGTNGYDLWQYGAPANRLLDVSFNVGFDYDIVMRACGRYTFTQYATPVPGDSEYPQVYGGALFLHTTRYNNPWDVYGFEARLTDEVVISNKGNSGTYAVARTLPRGIGPGDPIGSVFLKVYTTLKAGYTIKFEDIVVTFEVIKR